MSTSRQQQRRDVFECLIWRAGAPYLPLLPRFQELFPGVQPTPLVASVLFFTPIIREFISWCGVRQVPPPQRTMFPSFW
jgi:hypothetical protein